MYFKYLVIAPHALFKWSQIKRISLNSIGSTHFAAFRLPIISLYLVDLCQCLSLYIYLLRLRSRSSKFQQKVEHYTLAFYRWFFVLFCFCRRTNHIISFSGTQIWCLFKIPVSSSIQSLGKGKPNCSLHYCLWFYTSALLFLDDGDKRPYCHGRIVPASAYFRSFCSSLLSLFGVTTGNSGWSVSLLPECFITLQSQNLLWSTSDSHFSYEKALAKNSLHFGILNVRDTMSGLHRSARSAHTLNGVFRYFFIHDV